MFTKKSYSKKSNWKNNINIQNLPIDYTWEEIFNELFKDKRIKIINNLLNKYIQNDNNDANLLYPKPNYIFKAFCMTPLNEVKVVFIGQDPYFNNEIYKDRIVPQAYGLSFSVPLGFEIPSSLKNIYNNLKKYGHIKKIPFHGCLDYWAYQGCLMLNTALTVIDGQKNCHSSEWKWFTDKIIEEISNKLNNIVFVLWGGEAYKKIDLIDLDKHKVIISSHPSGLSANKEFKSYPAFVDQDHFCLINSHLQEPIDWNIEI
jgi:uracil-DNA glycosylase